jgi:hypothetical protein
MRSGKRRSPLLTNKVFLLLSTDHGIRHHEPRKKLGQKGFGMVSRKDVYGMLLSSLLGFAGTGCLQLPLQGPAQSAVPGQTAQLRSSGAEAPSASDRRSAGTLTKNSAPAENTSPPSRQYSAPAVSPTPASSLPASADGPPLPASATGTSIDPVAKLHSLYREGTDRYARIDSYIVRLTRREYFNGKDQPEEVLLLKFRKQPWSVYFKWLGTEGKGREVVYVRGQYENKIHTILAAGDIPLMPAGRRFSVAPDNPFVLSSSRHPIQQAGVGMLIERFGKWLDAADQHDHASGTVKYLGLMQRPEFASPADAVEQMIAPGADPLLPLGGHRLWVFDPVTKFPALLITQDDHGREVEYYCYDRFEFPVHLDDDDFNPDKLWPAKREATAHK